MTELLFKVEMIGDEVECTMKVDCDDSVRASAFIRAVEDNFRTMKMEITHRLMQKLCERIAKDDKVTP